jgi:tetratricopeptide (TPR) repeat protein
MLAGRAARASTGSPFEAANVPHMLAKDIERLIIRISLGLAAVVVVAAAVSLTPPGRQLLEHLTGGFDSTTDARSPIQQAEDALTAGDTATARLLAAQAMQGTPDASTAYRAGNVQLGAGDEKAAESDYLAGERLGASYPWNFIALGQLYARENNLLQADENLRAATNIAPSVQFLHYDLATVELREGLREAAAADFRAELKLSPDYAPARDGLAQALGHAPQSTVALTPPKPKPSAKLAIRPLVAPSPSPTSVPSPSPTVVAQATPTPTPTPTPVATPTPLPSRSARPTPRAHHVNVIQRVATPTPTPAPSLAPAPDLSKVSADARSYLLGVGQDLNFTRALPDADLTDSPAIIKTKVAAAHTDVELLRLGTGALLQGDLLTASAAYRAAATIAPNDWQPPYLEGLTAQALGDESGSRSWFLASARIADRPETYTSLALQALNDGDIGGALKDAQRAVYNDPNFGPAHFTAGMLAIIAANAPLARSELSVAIVLGRAPQRTGYFLKAAGG